MEKVYWFASSPKTGASLEQVQAKLQRPGYAECFRFTLPELRIGTLDSLMTLSDELLKHDSFVGNVTQKLAKHLFDLKLDVEKGAPVPEVDVDALLRVGQANIDPWMKKFRWDVGRWDYEKSSLANITEDIVRTSTRIDAALRQKGQEWIALNRSITSANSANNGSMMLRDLSGVVKKEHLVDTDSLATVLVVVPHMQKDAWFSTYETSFQDDGMKAKLDNAEGAGNYVVPRSSQVILEDGDNLLVTCTVLKPFLNEFKLRLREQRYTPRDFTFDSEASANQARSLASLVENRQRMKLELVKFCKTQFAEMFNCWVHLKSIRVWVESVLRFSLPADFNVILIKPVKKHEQKIRKILNDLYKDIVVADILESNETPEGVVIGFGNEDFFPYVNSELTIAVRSAF